MFFVHQHKDDDDIKDIVTNITSFKDIDINDIKNTDYLLIDTYGAIISTHAHTKFKSTVNELMIDDFINKYSLVDIDGNNVDNKYKGTLYPSKHTKNCKFANSIDIELHYHLRVLYLHEIDINKTMNEFKKKIPKLKIYAFGYINEGLKIKLSKFGINFIDNYIEKHKEKSIFDPNPEMICKQIAIVSSDINELQDIYKAYKTKYPQYMGKLKLYLYKNPFVLQIKAGDEKSTLTAIEQEYCNCKLNHNQGENQKNKIKAQATTKGEQNVT